MLCRLGGSGPVGVDRTGAPECARLHAPFFLLPAPPSLLFRLTSPCPSNLSSGAVFGVLLPNLLPPQCRGSQSPELSQRLACCRQNRMALDGMGPSPVSPTRP